MWWHKTCAWTLQQPTWSCPKQRISQTAREFILSLGVSSQNLICQPCTWPSEAGRLGRPEPPHFSWQMFIVYSRVPRLTSTLRWSVRRARGCESVHVVNINHVLPSGSWIARLCEFSSTFVFLSDCDVFVSTASTCDWWQGAPALLLPLSAAWFWEDVGGEAIVSAAVATVDRAGDRWLQIVWKRRFLVFKVRKCHESSSW